MKMTVQKQDIPLRAPFRITGFTFETLQAVCVTLEEDGAVGRGEGVGIYYLGETQETIIGQLESVRDEIEDGLIHQDLANALPRGGARNALDCAYWDLKAKKSQGTIWDMVKLEPKPVRTVATIGVDTPDSMAKGAKEFEQYSNLKIKLSDENPIERLSAVRNARPDAKLIIDVNQGWTVDQLRAYLSDLERLKIAMIEQPLPRGADKELEGFSSPIPLGADESCLDLNDYPAAAKRYDVINIKLDKCGGLSQGLELVEQCKKDGKGLMVGNMTGTSLSMAPAFVIAQFCDFVDIDGPLLLERDIDYGLIYQPGGIVSPPTKKLWG